MIRRIHLQRYKSLRDVDVALQPCQSCLVRTPRGKAIFIDALQLLSRIAGSRGLKETFDPPYRAKPMESFSLDETGLEGLIKKDSVSTRLITRRITRILQLLRRSCMMGERNWQLS